MTSIINPNVTANMSGRSGAQVLQDRYVLDTHTGLEAIKQQQIIPAGLFPIGRKIRVALSGYKSGTSFGTSFFVRLGVTGTTADATLHAVAAPLFISAAHTSGATEFVCVRIDATTVRFLTSGAITPRTSSSTTAANHADITFAAGVLDAHLYLSLGVSQTTETFTFKHFMVSISDGNL